MTPKRFKFALENLQASDWEKFEELASVFLVTEFDTLHTMASPSGDGGRDAELFSPSGEPSTLLQYSVQQDWKAKITATVKKVAEKFEADQLIYVTNQFIGAKADTLRNQLRKEYGIRVVIYDQSWFVERCEEPYQRQVAAERLAEQVADPIAISGGVLDKAQNLTTTENHAALVFLNMQLEDDTRDKGLTKLSFDALVRAALLRTNSKNRLKREEVHSRLQAMLPARHRKDVAERTDSALSRLEKRVIRHWRQQDEFCLTHEESERIKDRLIDSEEQENSLSSEIKEIVTSQVAYTETAVADPSTLDKITLRVRRVVERLLLSRGETFISAVQTGRYRFAGSKDIEDHITKDIAEHPRGKEEKTLDPKIIEQSVAFVLTDPGEKLRQHLRSLADGYTLLAFMRETADVQGAISKMFSHGDIWLDTNVTLPLFAEELAEDERKQFTSMVRAALEAGMNLHITPGVLEETESHMNLSLNYSRTPSGEWTGNIPFLYSAFVSSGRNPETFASWVENYRGRRRPEDDVAAYLSATFDIDVVSLESSAEEAEENIKNAVKEEWHQFRENRRQNHVGDSLQRTRLANHDIENYLGVVSRRKNERTDALGYSSWWLTLDRTAVTIESRLKAKHHISVSTPVMSPDFMMNYLAFGPVRGRISKDTEKALPIALELSRTELMPQEFINIAKDTRQRNHNLPEHVIQRKVRDALDEAKARRGPIAENGSQGVENELLTANALS